MKGQLYDNAETIEHLKANIRNAIAELWSHTLEKVYEHWCDQMRRQPYESEVATYKYSWNFGYEWFNSIEIQLLCFIRTQYNIYL